MTEVDARSGEDRHASGTDEEADDDQHDAPQNLAAKECHDAGDDEYHREDPQEKCHDPTLPEVN
jgi:hypothetical protein